ncbi:MAG: ABC transporter permease [Solirubrobacteraceae bacterium]
MSRGWWTLTLLVARRELRERLSARSFRISTLILIVGVACAVGIPALVSGGSSAAQVGVVGTSSGQAGDTAALEATVRQAGAVLDEKVAPVAVPSLASGRAQLRKGTLDALYVAGSEVLIEQEPAAGASDTKARLAGAIAQLARNPSPQAAAGPRALPVHGLKAAPTSLSTRLTGLAVVVLIYLLIFVYGQRITSGVVEEKSSRVVEVLLASVRPAQLLTGKVIGMGITALGQVAALVVTFVVVAEATGSNLLNGAAVGVVLVGALWMVLGYALYCTAFAAAGSLITRESDASNVTFPVALPLLFSYALSFGVIFGGSANPLFHVLSYIPPTAPIASTTLYAIGSVGLGQVAIAAVVCIATTVATARLAATVYERSILRTGSRVRLREALRAESGS